MKKNLGILVALVFIFLTRPSTTLASHPTMSHAGHPGIVYYGTWGGYPWLYGYWGWPNYAIYPYGYGYSFSSYYYYEPYHASFAAISYSPKEGIGGYSAGTSSLDQAIQISNSYCGAQDCKPVVWVQGGCAAVATNHAESSVGYAYATTRQMAARGALQACTQRSQHPENCKALGWACAF